METLGPTLERSLDLRSTALPAELEESHASASTWTSQRRFAWACILCFACLASGGGLLRGLTAPGDYVADFFQEWASAKNYFTGRPIYTPQRETALAYLNLTPTPDAFFVEINGHPPTAVLVALPFGMLDYGTAFLLWNWLSIAALTLSGVLIMRETGIRFSGWALLPALALAFGNPLLQHLCCGQLGALLLLLITGAWVADRRGHGAAAGALLAVATAIKLFPGFMFLYFVLKGKWRTVFVGAATFVALTALTAAVLGPHAFVEYVTQSMPEVSKYRGTWANASLVGFWQRLLSADSDRAVPLVRSAWLPGVAYLLSVTVVVSALARVTLRSRTRATDDLAFALFPIGMLLASPITWDHSFILLLMPILLVAHQLSQPELLRGAFRLTLAVLWLNPLFAWTLFLGANLTNVFAIVATTKQNLLVVSLPVYALCGFFAVAVATAGRAIRADEADAFEVEHVVPAATSI